MKRKSSELPNYSGNTMDQTVWSKSRVQPLFIRKLILNLIGLQTAPPKHVGTNFFIIHIFILHVHMHLHTFICHLIYLPASMFMWELCVLCPSPFTARFFPMQQKIQKLKSPAWTDAYVIHFLIQNGRGVRLLAYIRTDCRAVQHTQPCDIRVHFDPLLRTFFILCGTYAMIAYNILYY